MKWISRCILRAKPTSLWFGYEDIAMIFESNMQFTEPHVDTTVICFKWVLAQREEQRLQTLENEGLKGIVGPRRRA
jgi:hypothetical protein